MDHDSFPVKRGRKSGFSMIEVLVAVALLGVIVLPLMGIFGISLRTTHAGRGQVTAAFHAQAMMDAFVVAPVGARGAIPRTNIDAKYSFERQVRTHATGLTEVVIIVYWIEGRLSRTLRVVSLVAFN